MKAKLGAAIKRERSALGISQDELAHRAGLHRTYISDVERGMRNPSVESVEKLAAALRISVSKLFERAGDGTASSQSVVEILLVEDNPSDIEMTIRAFKQAYITNPVHILRNGQEALDFLFGNAEAGHIQTGGKSHLVLLDLNLPQASGIDVLARIKADKRTRKIPVIVLTASDQHRDIVACRRLGCEEYIVKPVEFKNFSRVTSHFHFGWTLVSETESSVGDGRKTA